MTLKVTSAKAQAKRDSCHQLVPIEGYFNILCGSSETRQIRVKHDLLQEVDLLNPNATCLMSVRDIYFIYFFLFLRPTEMSTNFSSSFNSSSPSFPQCSPSSIYQQIVHCMASTSSVVLLFFFTAANCIVLLPLCLLVCFVAYQRWRKHSPSRPNDLITYHQLANELFSILGWIICVCGYCIDLEGMMTTGLYLTSFGMQMNFHLLACVERYLAVVHPVVYLKLRKRHCILTRNIIICCTWLVSLGINMLLFQEKSVPISILTICVLISVGAIVVFFSMSALSVLIRSRPGEKSGRREHFEKSKRRPICTILLIMAALLIRLGGYILAISAFVLTQQDSLAVCGILLSTSWFCLPSGFVLPLLFLHRAGKLACCINKRK